MVKGKTKIKIIDALIAGKQTGPEIAKTLGVSLQYVCHIAREIKRRPKPCTLGRPLNNCKQEVLDTKNALSEDSA